MARILITGAAGFIGSHLTERLLARGDQVTGLDNFNDYYDPAVKRANLSEALEHADFRLHEGDICERPRLMELFEEERPEVVVHLAARAGVRPSLENPDLYNQVNVVGSQHVLDACREFKTENLLFASSSSVYGGSERVPFTEDDPVPRPISPYAATKRMNELMAHVYSHIYGLNISLFRFFTVYGPRQRPDMAIHKFTKLIEEGRPVPMFGDGSTRRDYTYVDDVIDGLVKAVDKPFRYEIFNLGEHHTTSLAELIALVEKHVGKPARLERLPLQPGDVTITYADIEKAREQLGYDPQYSMDEGIKRFVAWYRNEKAAAK